MPSEFDQTIEHRYIVTEEGVDKLIADLVRVQTNIENTGIASQKSAAGLSNYFRWLELIGAKGKGLGQFNTDLYAMVDRLRLAGQGSDKLTQSLEKISKAGIGISRVGVGIANMGRILGSGAVTEIGRTVTELGVMAGSLDDIAITLGNIKKLGGIGGIIAGAGIGALAIGAGQATGNLIRQATGEASPEDRVAAFQRLQAALNQLDPEAARQRMADLTTELERVGGPGTQAGVDLTNQFADEITHTGSAAVSATAQLKPLIAILKVAAAEITDAAAQFAQQQKGATDAYMTYQSRLKSLTAEGEETRLRIIEDGNERIADSDKRYAERRAQLIEDFASQSDAEEKSYYDNRAKLAAQFGLDTQRMEEDHQRGIRRLIEDSQLRQQDLIGGRDALGLARERRAVEIQRRRSEEDYAVVAGRRNADFARQIAEMESHFSEQRETRQADYEQRLKDLADQHAQERSDLANDLTEKLNMQRQAQANERNANRQSFIDRLSDLGFYLGQESELRQQAYNEALRQVNAFIQSIAQSNPVRTYPQPGYALGGYTVGGLAQLHGGEFVMTASTTRAAERMAGGRLSQRGLLSAMTNNFSFAGSLTDAERRSSRRWVREEVANAIRTVIN